VSDATLYPLRTRIRNAFNSFMRRRPEVQERLDSSASGGSTQSYPRHRVRMSVTNQRNMIAAILARVAIDVSSVKMRHVKVDKSDHFVVGVDSELNRCLTLDANIDQNARAFFMDVVISMLDEGHVAIVPVDTDEDPLDTEAFDILSMRTGKAVQWRPQTVKIRLYNDRSGEFEEIWMPKSKVSLIENPLFTVMNEPNSTLRRLLRKLNLLDEIDETIGAGKLDLIVQLPYALKGDTRKELAEERRLEIAEQLEDNKLGIAYIDGTEKVIQLNRAVVNNLQEQVVSLTTMLYGQLGITESILNGTADQGTMINYWVRTLEPIIGTICLEMTRKFISTTGYTQGKRIKAFRDIFALASASDFAELVDKLSRNEIATGNEFRATLGWEPSDDPGANKLKNKNIAPTQGSDDVKTSNDKVDKQIQKKEIQDNGENS
jgi:hypothetical protein